LLSSWLFLALLVLGARPLARAEHAVDRAVSRDQLRQHAVVGAIACPKALDGHRVAVADAVLGVAIAQHAAGGARLDLPARRLTVLIRHVYEEVRMRVGEAHLDD